MPGLARPDAGSPQIRLSRHAEGADGAGAGQDRSGADCGLRDPSPATPRPHPGRSSPIVDSISGFIAVIPAEPSPRLATARRGLHARIRFIPRAADGEDRARRNPAKLTPRQCDYLDRWGYPYVMEEFRFHMTLTGRLRAERREAVVAMLRERFAPIDLTRSPSTGSRCFARTTRRHDSGSSGTGRCARIARRELFGTEIVRTMTRQAVYRQYGLMLVRPAARDDLGGALGEQFETHRAAEFARAGRPGRLATFR